MCLEASSLSGSVLETLFKKWDSQEDLQCSSHHKHSHPVYIIQTTGEHTFTQSQTSPQWDVLFVQLMMFLLLLVLLVTTFIVGLQKQGFMASTVAFQEKFSSCFSGTPRAQPVCHNCKQELMHEKWWDHHNTIIAIMTILLICRQRFWFIRGQQCGKRHSWNWRNWFQRVERGRQ